MAVEALVLDDVPDAVWRAFHEGRGKSRSHAQHVERWSRSRRLGASHAGDAIDDALVRGEAFRLRAEQVDLLNTLGAEALARAAKHVSGRDFVLLLADADGLVVRAQGGGAFHDHARRVRLIEGASWSEAARGTNAIGTAAAEGRPTVVLGRAHFGRSYHGLACYAAPVLDVHGSTVAVIDATSSIEHATPEVGVAVFKAAEVLSELLRLEAYASAGGSVLRVLARSIDRASEPSLLIEAPGRVARLNAPARMALGGATAGGPVRALLGLDWHALIDESVRPTSGGRTVERVIDGRARTFRMHAEPLVDARGEALAVIVHLEAVAARAATAPRRHVVCDAFAPIFAEDPSVRSAIEWARLVAASELPVMILAETGSGKELFAQAMHVASHRADGPFVAVNCGAIAPTLLESELFGYAPSAFTGADRRGRTGLFHAASGGTLFLDEVAEMPLAMQAALLRVLESGAFQRVGDARTERCDVRVICATCRDLPAAVARGTFRQDLYYRLKGATLRLPALRERCDIVPLARHLLGLRAERAGWIAPPELSPSAEARIASHAWPGNVRELASALDVALIAARGARAECIEAVHLPLEEDGPARASGALERAEADTVRRALEAHGGNVSAAARELGVARSTLYRMARKLGIPMAAR
jgi:transcriptional regulator of acetoin/glycerol metabolism